MHKLISMLGVLAMALGIGGLVLARDLFAWSAPVIVVQASAAALMLWARLTFGLRSYHMPANPTAGGLVTSGPYRYVRHPIYASICWFVWPGIVAHWSGNAVWLALLMTAGVVVRIWCEERLLVAKYPEYARYAERTKRIIPFVF